MPPVPPTNPLDDFNNIGLQIIQTLSDVEYGMSRVTDFARNLAKELKDTSTQTKEVFQISTRIKNIFADIYEVTARLGTSYIDTEQVLRRQNQVASQLAQIDTKRNNLYSEYETSVRNVDKSKIKEKDVYREIEIKLKSGNDLVINTILKEALHFEQLKNQKNALQEIVDKKLSTTEIIKRAKDLETDYNISLGQNAKSRGEIARIMETGNALERAGLSDQEKLLYSYDKQEEAVKKISLYDQNIHKLQQDISDTYQTYSNNVTATNGVLLSKDEILEKINEAYKTNNTAVINGLSAEEKIIAARQGDIDLIIRKKIENTNIKDLTLDINKALEDYKNSLGGANAKVETEQELLTRISEIYDSNNQDLINTLTKEENRLYLLLKQKETLEEAAKQLATLKQKSEESNKALDKMQAKTEAIRKVLNALPFGIGKFIVPFLKLEKIAAGFGTGFKGMLTGFKALGGELTAMFGKSLFQLALIGAAAAAIYKTIKFLINEAFRFDKAITSISNNLGVSKEAGDALLNTYQQISAEGSKQVKSLDNAFLSVTNQGAALVELQNSLETNALLTDDMVQSQILMTKQMGMTNEEAAGFQKLSLLSGQRVEDILQNSVKQNKTSISYRKILSEISKVSAEISAMYKNNPDLIAKAVIQANKLGMSLEQTKKISDSLLNFESSIGNELEAELLIGKSLNFEKARALALDGKSAEAAQEIMGQLGGINALTGLNVIQRDRIANAIGLSTEEMMKSAQQADILNKLGFKDREALEEKYELLRKSNDLEGLAALQRDAAKKQGGELLLQDIAKASLQQRFEESLNRIKELFSKIASGPFMGFIETVVKWLTDEKNLKSIAEFGKLVRDIVEGIATVIKGISSISGIFKWMIPTTASISTISAIKNTFSSESEQSNKTAPLENFDAGGIIKETGPAIVHKGEAYLGANTKDLFVQMTENVKEQTQSTKKQNEDISEYLKKSVTANESVANKLNKTDLTDTRIQKTNTTDISKSSISETAIAKSKNDVSLDTQNKSLLEQNKNLISENNFVKNTSIADQNKTISKLNETIVSKINKIDSSDSKIKTYNTDFNKNNILEATVSNINTNTSLANNNLIDQNKTISKLNEFIVSKTNKIEATDSLINNNSTISDQNKSLSKLNETIVSKIDKSNSTNSIINNNSTISDQNKTLLDQNKNLISENSIVKNTSLTDQNKTLLDQNKNLISENSIVKNTSLTDQNKTLLDQNKNLISENFKLRDVSLISQNEELTRKNEDIVTKNNVLDSNSSKIQLQALAQENINIRSQNESLKSVASTIQEISSLNESSKIENQYLSSTKPMLEADNKAQIVATNNEMKLPESNLLDKTENKQDTTNNILIEKLETLITAVRQGKNIYMDTIKVNTAMGMSAHSHA